MIKKIYTIQNIFLKPLIFGIFSAVLLSCNTNRLAIVEPLEQYNKPLVNTELSTIGLAINVSIPELEKSLNQSLQGLIYEDKDFSDDSRYVKVWKTGPILFSVDGSVISYQLPIKIWIKTGFKKELFGKKIENYYEANGALVVNMMSKFTVNKHWQLITNSKITNYRWTEDPEIKAGGIKIPAKTITDMILFTLNSNIISEIDKTITEKINLRNALKTKWNEFHHPILINQDLGIWIKMQPKNLALTPIFSSNKQMQFNIAYEALIETFVGIKPVSAKTVTPLPDLQQINSIEPYFSIHSKIEIPFKTITDIANKLVVGQEFKRGKKRVIIDSIHVWGQNDNLVVKASLSGSVEGDIYCLGTVTVIDSTQTIKITDFDFELNTKKSLLKSADWLLHKSFLKKIEPMLTIPLHNYTQKAINASNEYFKNYSFDKGINLNGSLHDIKLQKITLSRDGFIINGKIDGIMRVNITDWF